MSSQPLNSSLLSVVISDTSGRKSEADGHSILGEEEKRDIEGTHENRKNGREVSGRIKDRTLIQAVTQRKVLSPFS